jgi:hypothetical protein
VKYNIFSNKKEKQKKSEIKENLIGDFVNFRQKISSLILKFLYSRTTNLL